MKLIAAHGEWLTLEQASRRLGVHATTLRRWANGGAIDVFLTPGGHRRFRLSDLERFERERHQSRLPVAAEEKWADHAITRSREGIHEQRWAVPYGHAERETKRHLGRRLMGLLLQYLARPSDDPDLLAEARAIGEQHARDGQILGQSLADLLQAISFFRTTLLDVAILELPHARSSQPDASRHLLHRIERLLAEVQTGVADRYQGVEDGE